MSRPSTTYTTTVLDLPLPTFSVAPPHLGWGRSLVAKLGLRQKGCTSSFTRAKEKNPTFISFNHLPTSCSDLFLPLGSINTPHLSWVLLPRHKEKPATQLCLLGPLAYHFRWWSGAPLWLQGSSTGSDCLLPAHPSLTDPQRYSWHLLTAPGHCMSLGPAVNRRARQGKREKEGEVGKGRKEGRRKRKRETKEEELLT